MPKPLFLSSCPSYFLDLSGGPKTLTLRERQRATIGERQRATPIVERERQRATLRERQRATSSACERQRATRAPASSALVYPESNVSMLAIFGGTGDRGNDG